MDLVASLLVGVVAAVLTHALTTRRFYSQKWWERKADVYSEILETLADIEVQNERNWRNVVDRQTVNEDTQFGVAHEAEIRLRKLQKIGAFVVSKDVAECLRSLPSELAAIGTRRKRRREAQPDAPIKEDAEIYFLECGNAVQGTIDTIRERGTRELRPRWWQVLSR